MSLASQPPPNPNHGPVAQLGERHTGSVEVRGSSPLRSTNLKVSPHAVFSRMGVFLCPSDSVTFKAHHTIHHTTRIIFLHLAGVNLSMWHLAWHLRGSFSLTPGKHPG